jgi:hypothetical protein
MRKKKDEPYIIMTFAYKEICTLQLLANFRISLFY